MLYIKTIMSTSKYIEQLWVALFLSSKGGWRQDRGCREGQESAVLSLEGLAGDFAIDLFYFSIRLYGIVAWIT